MCVLNWALLELCIIICFLLWPKRLCSESSEHLAGAAAVVSIAWQKCRSDCTLESTVFHKRKNHAPL